MMDPSLNNNDNIHSKIPQEIYQTPYSSTFLLPSPIYIPIEDEAAFCEFFQQQQFFSNDHNHNILLHEMSSKNVDTALVECSNNNRQIETNDGELDNDSPRKIPSNRDRHSKINTARGPRDRRMRLSLDVAKRLFGLQDLLGFDKASKTVDWLLTESKTAILELLPDQNCSFMDASNSRSYTSECEVVTGDDDQVTIKAKAKSCSGGIKKQKEKIVKVRKCVDFQNPLAKETRVKARQRARERTIQKQKNYNQLNDQMSSTFTKPFVDQVMDQDLNQLGSWSTFQESQRRSIDRLNDQMSLNFGFNHGFAGDNSSYFFDHPHSSGLMDENQFNDLQAREAAWECNNMN